MEPFTPNPDACAIVERAVRHAWEHAVAMGDNDTATELAAILTAMTVRQAGAARLSGWDTVPATGRTH